MSISENIKRLKRRYYNSKSQKESIGRDLIAPCLRECKLYRRGTGFFKLSVFRTYILSLDELINNDVKIEIVCSPKIDHRLYESICSVTNDSDREKIIHDFINDFISDVSGIKVGNDPDYFQRLCCYLLSKGMLEIKFAIPVKDVDLEILLLEEEEELPSSNLAERNMYHIKHGYFEFSGGARLAFEGSANESASAHMYNQEGFTVFKSWVQNDINDVNEVTKKVDRDWGVNEENRNKDIRIYPIGPEILKIIDSAATTERPVRTKTKDTKNPPTESKEGSESNKYRHQEEAVDVFLEKKHGILNMATGTGKTRTALKIVNALTEKKLIDQFIVTCYGKDLLSQWNEILNDRKDVESKKISNDYSRILYGKKDRQRFSLDPDKSGLLTSIDDLHYLESMDKKVLERTLIIYDEVHNLGTETRVNRLEQLNADIPYRLGLSATPEKGEYNTEMTEAIQFQIGEIIFTFGLEDAIKRGILCEFDYIKLDYYLNSDDKLKQKRYQAARSKLKKEGKPMSDEEFARLMASVYKNSETKLESFDQYLKNNKDILKSTIIFVETEEYGEKVMEIINEYTTSYRTYYGKTDRSVLENFIKDKTDVLITCKAISQGIDIPTLENVILFSSDKNLGVTIQRLGRCLRNPSSDVKKIARVIDFIEIPDDNKESYDIKRDAWLTKLSETKPEKNA